MSAPLNFQREVIDASFEQPVLVDFWASWCAPCRILGPILEKLAARADGRFKLVKVDTELQPELAMQYRVQSIPAVKLFSEGAPVAEFVGALPEAAVESWLEQHVPSASGKLLQAARTALASGDEARARDLLARSVEEDPTNDEARVLLAQQCFAEEPEEALKMVEGIDEGNPFFDAADSMRTLGRLAQLAGTEAPEGVAPELWRRYQEGVRAYLGNDYGAALDAWLDVMRRDRKLDDDGARRATVALFQLLGDEHELTQTYRRQLAAALY